jgi:UDP-N-acetylglucosamine enolpyruvyl transferase
MTHEAGTVLRVEVARETEAVDLARFVQELGLAVTRHGTTVEVAEAPADIGHAVTTWLAECHTPLVPAAAPGRHLR